MGNQDGFEKLIKNFKLDDLDEPEETPVRRKVFDFEQDDRRRAAPIEQREQPPAGQAAPAARREQPRQASVRPAVMEQPRREQRKTFQVKIDDEEFYEPSPAPVTAGGGGGGGNRGGRRGRGDGGGQQDGGGAGRWAKALVVLVVVLGVSVFLAFFALQAAGDLFGLNKPDKQIPFDLAGGLSMSEIAGSLKGDGIITQPLVFQLYASLKNDPEEFQSGSYMLNSNMSYDQIMIAFKNHAVPKIEVKLMFPEGSTLLEIADQLEEGKVCSKKDLFAYLDKAEFPWKYGFLENVPDDPNRFRRYEGYFFPDTYNFYEQESVETVVQKFFYRFNELTATDEMKNLLKENNMTLDQAVTLASMVQKEAGKVKDMKNVSAVFHKRLLNPDVLPTLGSDVTILYVERNIKPYLNKTNQEMFDAYNTYVCTGLPVGPICNPGMDAIQAVLDYEPTDNYYFLADKDGNFYYAKTLDEHNANIRAAGITGVHGLNVPQD